MPEPGLLTARDEARALRDRRDQERLDEQAAFVTRVRKCEDYRMAETTFPALLAGLSFAAGYANRLRAELLELRAEKGRRA